MNNPSTLSSLLNSSKLCIFFLVILSKRCSGADYRYESCAPLLCGGVNISYPFYVPGLQESYCSFPRFQLNCSNLGFPVLRLPDNDYVVENISYVNRTLRVYDSAALSSSASDCLPRIRNVTLPITQFEYVGVERIHLFSNCPRQLNEALLRYRAVCDGERSGNWDLALYDDDVDGEMLRMALDECERNVVLPVERRGGDGNDGIGNLLVVLRKGFELKWIASVCDTCQGSGGRCGFNETVLQFQCFCPDRPHSRSCKPGKNISRRILSTVGISVIILIAISIMSFIFIRRKNTLLRSLGLGGSKTEKRMEIENFLKNNENLARKRYKYSHLKRMTNSFKHILGKGGYGSVYKGKLRDGRLVAVKILSESKGDGEEFMNEVAIINRTSHVNIVSLLGYCFEGSKRALVYEFMPNGSLDKFIPDTTSLESPSLLGLKKLFEIAVGIARGLEYLHQGCNTRILHFDIKPHNILLDKDFKPKISDFGLSKLCPNRSSIVSMLVARGTIGYIAPEVFCRNFGEVSHKSDVYSYGMMVLEMVVGRNSIQSQGDTSGEMYFPDMIYKNLEQNDAKNGVGTRNIVEDDESEFAKKTLMIIGLWCIQTEPKNRPSITRVIEMLEGKCGCLQIPPRPYLYTPPRSTLNLSFSESIV